MNPAATAGGFLPHSLPSPPQSSVHSSISSPRLPHPRASPLKSGGAKESGLIRYMDQHILQIRRRHAKRNSGDEVALDAKGYESFSEVAKDVDRLVDVMWVSGTPSLQVPFLLTLALLVVEILPDFPVSPKATFRLLGKLDHAFASLLQGRDIDTGETLPGFERGRRVTATDKVRLKSLVDRTRSTVLQALNNGEVGVEEDEENEDSDDEDSGREDKMDEDGGFGVDDDVWDVETSKVYDKTIVEIGDSLKGSNTPIGLITDD